MIYLPPPQPVLNSDIRISGDVDIHPTASLAAGVILQAANDCRIVIGADVCIGMGAIINATHGSIEIESGATLGSGVLILGASKVGNNACIGTATTIFQTSVAAMAVINPGSILGDSSRQVQVNETPSVATKDRQDTVKDSDSLSSATNSTANSNGKSAVNRSPSTTKNGKTAKSDKSNRLNDREPAKADSVLGKVYIDQLLVTLFPHRESLKSNNQIDRDNNT